MWYADDLRAIAKRLLDDLPLGWQRNTRIVFKHRGQKKQQSTYGGYTIRIIVPKVMKERNKVRIARDIEKALRGYYNPYQSQPSYFTCTLRMLAHYSWAAEMEVRAKQNGKPRLTGENRVREQLAHAETKRQEWTTRRKRSQTVEKKWATKVKRLKKKLEKLQSPEPSESL